MLLRLVERRITRRPAIVQRTRELPLDGQLTIEIGDTVRATEVIGRARVPLPPIAIPVATMLGVEPDMAERYLKRQPGESIGAGEIIAERRRLPWRKVTCTSPSSGKLVGLHRSRGELLLVPSPLEQELRAFVGGTVVSVMPRRAVTIETTAIVVTGVGGFGGEVMGTLRIATERPNEPLGKVTTVRGVGALTGRNGGSQVAGAVLVAGTADRESLEAARLAGVAAVVVGSMRASDFAQAQRDGGMALVVLEGFGRSGMSSETFEVLSLHSGRSVSVSASHHWPELLIPSGISQAVEPLDAVQPGVGAMVRKASGGSGSGTPRLGTVSAFGPAYAGGPAGAEARWVEVDWGSERQRLLPEALELVDG